MTELAVDRRPSTPPDRTLMARGDRAMTADRDELKFLLDRARLDRFLGAVSRHLPVHRFTGEGANALPDPESFITTIYFDTASNAQLRAALENSQQNVKIRAREYYDLHASLAELATDPIQCIHYKPWVWFEIKRRDGGRTQKHRFRLNKREVPSFFRGEHAAFSREIHDDAELASIVAYRRTLTEPLVPSVIVNYHRIPFQDASGSLRITVDLDVSFYRPPADLWTRTHALVRGTFGAPVEVERRALIEVKSRGSIPEWLRSALAAGEVQSSSYSKFARGGRAVHGIG
ncbi:MAG: polyphosphate polymerase domain-containing protein [Polyangiales bacterium]